MLAPRLATFKRPIPNPSFARLPTRPHALLPHSPNTSRHNSDIRRLAYPVHPSRSASETETRPYLHRLAFVVLTFGVAYALDRELNASAITRNLRTIWTVRIPTPLCVPRSRARMLVCSYSPREDCGLGIVGCRLMASTAMVSHVPVMPSHNPPPSPIY